VFILFVNDLFSKLLLQHLLLLLNSSKFFLIPTHFSHKLIFLGCISANLLLREE